MVNRTVTEKRGAKKLDGERTSLPGQHPLATVKKTCAPKCAVSLSSVLSNDAKKTVRFVCDAGGEEDAVGEWQKIPQTIKLERRSIGAHERLDEISADRIVIVDETITKVADPKFVALYQSKTPRSIEVAV